MNWFKRSTLRASFGRRRSETFHAGDSETSLPAASREDVVASFETFNKHWQQLQDILRQTATSFDEDDVLAVIGHLEHLVTLVVIEFQSNSSSACLDFLLRADIFNEVFSWSTKVADRQSLDLTLAQSMERIITEARTAKTANQIALLRHPALHVPIQQLLIKLENNELNGKLEEALASLCASIAILITREPGFLDLFFDLAHLEKGPRFPLMSVLVNCLYKDNRLGEQAREGLMLCMGLAKENAFLSQYIALYSSFCPVVATGLSGLYSALPRKLPDEIADRGLITQHDIATVPEISAFVTALEFCNAVVGSAPWPVVDQLLGYFYNGFLVPVLGPALFQNTMEEILAATCYLTVCLRRAEHRSLIGIFVRFVLKQTYEDKSIIDILIDRLSSTSKLRLATLNLFAALVDLHCEDVMFYLVFKYLIPCGHVMQSQRGQALVQKDYSGEWAAKFLSFVPEACKLVPVAKNLKETATKEDGRNSNRVRRWSNNSDSSGNDTQYGRLAFTSDDRSTTSRAESFKLSDRQDFSRISRLHNYLREAQLRVQKSLLATSKWAYPYDGETPPLRPAKKTNKSPESNLSEDIEDLELSTSTPEAPVDFKLGHQTAEEFYASALEELNSLLNEINVTSPARSSGYESFNFNNVNSLDMGLDSGSYLPTELQRDLEFWSFMRDDEDVDLSKVSAAIGRDEVEDEEGLNTQQRSAPSVGPFLDQIVRAVDSWLSNSVQVNLTLCGLISSLSTYPQPLLNSYLLNPALVVQPSVPSLFSCLAQLKQRIDSAIYNVENPASAVAEAHIELERLAPAVNPARLRNTENAASLLGEARRRGGSISAALNSLFFKRANPDNAIAENPLEEAANGSGFRYVAKQEDSSHPSRSDPIGRHVTLCAVLLEEWLYELAALAMEHAISFIPMPMPTAHLT